MHKEFFWGISAMEHAQLAFTSQLFPVAKQMDIFPLQWELHLLFQLLLPISKASSFLSARKKSELGRQDEVASERGNGYHERLLLSNSKCNQSACLTVTEKRPGHNTKLQWNFKNFLEALGGRWYGRWLPERKAEPSGVRLQNQQGNTDKRGCMICQWSQGVKDREKAIYMNPSLLHLILAKRPRCNSKSSGYLLLHRE